MNVITAPDRWLFRLKVVTGMAVFLLLVIVISAGADRRDVARRRAALITNLQRLAERQADFYDRNNRYAHLDEAGLDFAATAGVVVRVPVAERDRWSAVSMDPLLKVAPANCGIFVGNASASPHRAVIHEATPGCW